MKRLILISVLALLVSCGSTKKLEQSSHVEITTKKDSTYVENNSTVIKGGNETTVVKDVVDTLTGKLKDFEYNTVIGNSKLKVKSKGNDINITADVEDQVCNSTTLFQYKDNDHKVVDTLVKEKVRTVWSKWTWIFLFIALVEAFSIVYIFKLNLIEWISAIWKSLFK